MKTMQALIIKLVYLVVLSLGVSGSVAALDCEVMFRAKKVDIQSKWYGGVKKTKTLSGKIQGQGNTKSLCEQNALKKIKDQGWSITYQKTIKP